MFRITNNEVENAFSGRNHSEVINDAAKKSDRQRSFLQILCFLCLKFLGYILRLNVQPVQVCAWRGVLRVFQDRLNKFYSRYYMSNFSYSDRAMVNSGVVLE